jgi:hypothetical protein
MRTPFGQECKYYYADFYRGRNQQACRLIEANPASEPWQPEVCRDCPVPGIQRANACEHLVLSGRVVKGFLGFGRKMAVEASCLKTKRAVPEPHIGCGECHASASIATLFGGESTD